MTSAALAGCFTCTNLMALLLHQRKTSWPNLADLITVFVPHCSCRLHPQHRSFLVMSALTGNGLMQLTFIQESWVFYLVFVTICLLCLTILNSDLNLGGPLMQPLPLIWPISQMAFDVAKNSVLASAELFGKWADYLLGSSQWYKQRSGNYQTRA